MKRLAQIFIFLMGSIICASAFSQILWQKAESGMNVNQVKKVFPSAISINPSSASTLGDGALRLLEIKDYQINGFSFDAYFYFKDQKLIQINLESTETYSELVYSSMVDAFRAKYKREIKTKSLGIGDESKFWMTPQKTQVRVMYLNGKTSVIYSGRISSELNKL